MLDTLGHIRDIEVDKPGGRVVAEFEARPEFTHSGGIVQGGFITGWIDSTMARAALGMSDAHRNLATLEIKVSFFSPALKGSRIRVESWVEKMGRSIVFLAGRATNEDGEVVATGTSTGRMIPRRTPPTPESSQS